MITDKFKRTIFDKLTSDLSGVELIFHDESLWFIDRKNKYWYIEFKKDGKLYWRWQFFSIFFILFTMERDEYEPLIKEWVESVLNCGVTTFFSIMDDDTLRVESVLDSRITTTISNHLPGKKTIESVLNGKVTTTNSCWCNEQPTIELVLNSRITTTVLNDGYYYEEVESVLNNPSLGPRR